MKQPMLIGLVVVLITVIIILTVQSRTQPKVPSGWSKVLIGNRLSFWVPPNLQAEPRQSVDSLAGELRGEGCALRYDFGESADALDSYRQHSNYVERQTVIDGKQAKLVSFTDETNQEHVAAIHFGRLGRNKRLTIYVGCNSAEKARELDAVFALIRFH